MKAKILVILGPTASGKSALAIALAQKYNGEVISADSRQIYTGLDIGTGKVTKKEMRGVPHHLLDVSNPKKTYSVSSWKKAAEEAILKIIKKGKLPIICGGTGFYIQSVVDNVLLPEVPPNPSLRKKLEQKTAGELFLILKKLDPLRAQTIEKENPVRLIRAIEITTTLGSVPKIKKMKVPYEILQIGLSLPEAELKEKIHTRLLLRVKKGMIKEAKTLHARGLSWKRMHELGLEYRYLADFLQKKISKEELSRQIEKGNWHYARRQMTWWKRDKRIKWFHPKESDRIEKEVETFLRS